MQHSLLLVCSGKATQCQGEMVQEEASVVVNGGKAGSV